MLFTKTEDHVGILCEIVAGLASGRLPAPPELSRTVFEKHPAPWIGRFFADLERAEAGNSTGA
jgi:TorA maturation chaperone TorD